MLLSDAQLCARCSTILKQLLNGKWVQLYEYCLSVGKYFWSSKYDNIIFGAVTYQMNVFLPQSNMQIYIVKCICKEMHSSILSN